MSPVATVSCIFHARYVHLSAGELLREERASGSSDGQLIDEYIREGRIVPVGISLGLLRKAMEASGPHARFLIDGFPRNSDNVEASRAKRSIDAVWPLPDVCFPFRLVFHVALRYT